MCYFYYDLECLSTALEMLESALKIYLGFTDENNVKLQKYYLLLSQMNVRNYSISNAVNYYEKYYHLMKISYKDCKEGSSEDKLLKSNEKILEGMKLTETQLEKAFTA